MSIDTWKVRALTAGLVLTFGVSAEAVPPKKKDAKTETKAEPKADDAQAPMVKGGIQLEPKAPGMKWGITQADLETVVDGFIDESAKDDYKKATSGPRLKDIEAGVIQKKAAFRRTKVDLTAGPTGLDSSPIAAEYTKGNGEMLMRHDYGAGRRIWFFFIGGRLWKTREEVTLTEGGPYGKDIGEAAGKIVASVGGTMPRAIPADPAKQKFYDVVDWQDAVTHMRVWDQSGTMIVMREDKSTLSNLANLRKNHVSSGAGALDPQVAAALRGPDPAPPPDKAPPPKK